jgi:protease YdgD
VTNKSGAKELAGAVLAGNFSGSGSGVRAAGTADSTALRAVDGEAPARELNHIGWRRLRARILTAALPILFILVANDSWSQSRRQIVDTNNFPWSSIGKLNNGAGGQCTATVIGSTQFLTAAHCLYNFGAGRYISPGSIHLLLGYERGKYRLHRVAVRYFVSPNFNPTKINGPTRELADDWAILDTNEPFPTVIKPLRISPTPPPLGKAVITVGFAQERAYMMTADRHCRIESISKGGKMIIHDCAISHGDSGGPLLSGDANEQDLIVGINVAKKTLTQGGESISTVNVFEHSSKSVRSVDGLSDGGVLSTTPTDEQIKAAKLTEHSF